MESRKRVKKLEKVNDFVPVSGMPSVNPLLIDLVLDNVFSYFENSPPSNIKNLRLVCKLWNRKINSVLRKKTEIDIIRLISPYPKGLGWTTKSSGENGEPSYIYRCPYPVDNNFENFKVIGTCQTLKNAAVIRWFERMGSKVKSLHFKSSLTCFHHTRFLECVMKLWCKNLSRLYLDEFIFFKRFWFKGKFNKDPFLMDKLKEIILNGESDEGKSSDCDRLITLQRTYLDYTQSDSEESDEDILDMNDVFETYWGVWENIITHVGSEKLLIKNLPPDSNACRNLFLRKIFKNSARIQRLEDTLKDFEYQNFPFFDNSSCLNLFREIKFSLSKLCFGPLTSNLDGSSVTLLLESLSATLKHLEFEGTVLDQSGAVNGTVNFRIPPLPHLKVFKNRDFLHTHTGTLDFVKNLPSLETCSLRTDGHARDMFPVGLELEHNNFEQNNLKELELLGKIRHGTHIERVGNWFPNLKTLAVILRGRRAFIKFMDLVQTVGLEEVKIFSYIDDILLNNDLISFLCDMPNLRFLELVYLTNRPFNISLSNCENAFANAPKLTSLKLKNVSMFIHERKQIRAVLSRISCVRLTDCVFQMMRPTSPTNLEFSIGNDVQFPIID